MKEWHGLANGPGYEIAEKRVARRGDDKMPAWVTAGIARTFGVNRAVVHAAWRDGTLDLAAEDTPAGTMIVFFTNSEQAGELPGRLRPGRHARPAPMSADRLIQKPVSGQTLETSRYGTVTVVEVHDGTGLTISVQDRLNRVWDLERDEDGWWVLALGQLPVAS